MTHASFRIRRAAGWACTAQGLLIFVPLAVLGSAIGWPSSLGDPAAQVLPRLSEQEGAVRLGYLVYLAYSVLFGLTTFLLLRLVEPQLPVTALRLAQGFAVASVLARCLGIVRWLGPMPVLADAYAAADDDATRQGIETTYVAVDAYGGTIGEALGVGLLAAVPLGVVAAGLVRSSGVPRVVALGAVLAALAVAVNVVELAGPDLGLVLSVSVSVVQVWFLGTGAWLLLGSAGVRTGGTSPAPTRARAARTPGGERSSR